MTATDSKLRFLPWVVLGVAVVYLLSRITPPPLGQ